ncbi:MAG TPA: sigma-70 family RNA polymerase sigma factor [Planctomycetota bacterium]|nr:sigma-70 family RNA polymerase sigma factor [Planctomycetota bacterium]
MTALPHDLQRLLAEEPFVRALAQQLVAGEADEVVQQTWLRVLERRPGLLQKPRQWLASVVRNLVADRHRRDRRRDEREREMAPAGGVLSASDLVAIEETRRELVAAVNALSDPLRVVVVLRFYEGLPPRRIAARLGVTPSAVSNRLHAAIRELRQRLDARGGRRAWVLALSPIANAPCELPWRELAAPSAAEAAIGVIAMTTKTKIVAASAAVLVGALAIVTWPLLREPAVVPTAAHERAAPVSAALADAHGDTPQPAEPLQRDVVPVPATDRATTGTVAVHVRYGDEPAVASGVTVHCYDDRLGKPLRSAITDEAGKARLEGIPPGRIEVFAAVHALGGRSVEVAAGTESECTLELTGGITLTGVVVDSRGLPVGGAQLELLPAPGMPIAWPGITAADGTFALRQCQPTCLISARAVGHAASQTYLVNAKPGSIEHVRIELRAAGGCVAGRIVDREGAPVSGAVLQVGSRASENQSMTAQGGEPLAAQVSADGDGRFLAVGVAAGAHPVLALATGLAPWRGTVDVSAGATTQLTVTLTPGVTCCGTVRSAEGLALARVDIAYVDNDHWFRIETRSEGDGSFTLAGVPPGETVLGAWHQKHGRGSVVVHGADGETVRRDIVVSAGVVLRGRVLDGDGAPLASVVIHLEGTKTWLDGASSDRQGNFVANNCPVDQRITARITQRGHLAFVQSDIDPRAGEVVLRLERDTAPPARIVARVLRADGTPAAGDTVEVLRTDAINPCEAATLAADGTCTFDVAAGTWRLFVSAKNHAPYATEPRRVDAGAAWDAGTIQLDRGGIVRVADGEGPALEYRIVTTDGRRLGRLQSPALPQRSDLLNAGDYVLLVRGENVAAHAIPFTIRSGEETVVAVKRTAGVRQRFTFTGVKSFELRAGGRHVASCETQESLWLAPGDYSLTARAGDTTATVSFTVAAVEGPPVHVEVR